MGVSPLGEMRLKPEVIAACIAATATRAFLQDNMLPNAKSTKEEETCDGSGGGELLFGGVSVPACSPLRHLRRVAGG